MITVTARAQSKLEELLQLNDAAPDEGVKVVASEQGTLGLTIARPSEDDEVLLYRGDGPLLIVDGRLAPDLDGLELDARRAGDDGTQPGEQFTLARPGAGR